MKLEDAWIYSLRSDALRGISKKRGLFTAGYYSFPLSPHYIKWIAEARDIITVMNQRHIKAIEMLDANRMLIDILVHNGVVVVCRAISTEEGVYKDKKDKAAGIVTPGVYARVPCAVSLYRGLPLKPVLDQKTVKFEKVVPMVDGELRSMYLHAQLPVCAVYPSVRVADGVVMTYFSVVEHSKPKTPQVQSLQKTVGLLSTRFCRAVTWRNVYVFTRVPYYIRDPYADSFVQGIKYPRLKDDKEPTMFKNAEVEAIDMKPRLIQDEELGPIVKLRVKPQEYEVQDIELGEDVYALLYERAGISNGDTIELHHFLYQALVQSKHAVEALRELVRTNSRLFWRVMKDIEKTLMPDQTIIPTLKLVQLDYISYRENEDYYSAEHVDYESWESDVDEKEDDLEGNDDEEVPEETQKVIPPEETQEDDDMFAQSVKVGDD